MASEVPCKPDVGDFRQGELGIGFPPFESRVSPTYLAGGILCEVTSKVLPFPKDGIRRNGLKSWDSRGPMERLPIM